MTAFYYLASPYSRFPDGPEAAFREVCRAAACLIRAGVRLYSPIAHTHPIATHGGIDPLDHSIWLPVDKPFMDAAAGLIVCKMPSWTASVGMAHEIEAFTEAGKPIVYMEWPVTDEVAVAIDVLAQMRVREFAA
jgi:hypothetical protein